MQFPAIGIRLRMLLLGILPAIFIFATVLWLNYSRMQSMLLSFSEEVLVERVRRIAGEFDCEGPAADQAAADAVAARLQADKREQQRAGWHPELFVIDREGRLIAATVATADLAGKPIADTETGLAETAGNAVGLGKGLRIREVTAIARQGQAIRMRAKAAKEQIGHMHGGSP